MIAVTDHELPAAFVLRLGVPRDPVVYLGVDGLRPHPLGRVTQNRGQNIPTGRWNRRSSFVTRTHRRSPLPIVVGSEPRTGPERVRRLFQPAINEIR